MFTKEELLVIEDALKIADAEYIRLIEENKNNKNKRFKFKNLIFLKNYSNKYCHKNFFKNNTEYPLIYKKRSVLIYLWL